MRTNKNTPKIILAITVALLATLISYTTFSSMQKELNEQKKLINVMQQVQTANKNKIETFAYAVSTKELKSGEIVSEDDVDFKNFTVEDKEAFDNRSDIVNKVLLKDIGMGEVFTSSHIAKISSDNIELKEGYRALTLPADNFQGKSAKMKIGSLIDIYSSNTDSPWFLEGIKILNFESRQKTDTAQNSKDISIFDANSITFEVPVAYVPDFISNASKNKLVLVTRGEHEKTIRRSAPSSAVKKHTETSINYKAEANRLNSLPKMPKSLPSISGISSPAVSGSGEFRDLPAPVQPKAEGPSVEIIEANVKSKVTFD